MPKDGFASNSASRRSASAIPSQGSTTTRSSKLPRAAAGISMDPDEEESGRIPDGRRTPVVRRSARGTGSRDRRWRSGSCLSCLDPSRQPPMGIGECDYVRRNRATCSRRKSPTSHRLGCDHGRVKWRTTKRHVTNSSAAIPRRRVPWAIASGRSGR